MSEFIFRPTLNAVYNVTERLNVDIGIHYIVHKLTKMETNKMKSNKTSDLHLENVDIDNNNNDDEGEMKKDAAFSEQIKYYVIQVNLKLKSTNQ